MSVRFILFPDRLRQRIHQEIGPLLAAAGIVIAVEIVAILGQDEFGAAAFRPELDTGLADRNLAVVQMHYIAVDDAPLSIGRRLDDVEIDAVEARDHAGLLEAAGLHFLAADLEIET